MAHIITVGNEKGGAGKSTVSMHLATALARMGHSISCFDLDLRQKSLARYVENRTAYLTSEGLDLPTPSYTPISENDDLTAAVAAQAETHAFILIDCPGSHTPLAQAAHAMADTLVTPLNDSFIDFDLLAKVKSDGETIIGPSVYSEMVWSARQRRAHAGQKPIDWVVVRNRLGSQNMVNKQKMEAAVDNLAKRIGFRTAPGFGERVIFRELFPRGLTLLDLRDVGVTKLSISNVAARQELRELVKALSLPDVSVDF